MAVESQTYCFLQPDPGFLFFQLEVLRRRLEETTLRGGPRAECVGTTERSGRKEQLAATEPLANSPTELAAAEGTKEEDDPNAPLFLPEVNGHPRDQETDGGSLSTSGGVPVLPQEDCRSAVPVPLQATSSVASSRDPEHTGSSPPPAQRPAPGSPGSFQSSYQAGINQRFHAARHKFQGTVDPDLPPASPASPAVQACQPAPAPSAKDAAPAPGASPEATPVKQLARSTVTQALSRFTTAQQGASAAKPSAPNNSPFGTDYRNLSAPLSPVIGRAQGLRSPTIPRAERGNPPPIPPKKPGLAQAPASPALGARSAALYSESPIAASCGLTSSQEGVKELDIVVSSN